MHSDHYLEAIATDSAHLAGLAAGALDHPIDFLDDWTVRELVGHLGAVYSMVIANTRTDSPERVPPGDEARAPEGDAINDWFAERRTTLLATLSAANPAAEAWTFAGPKTTGWWVRRMASETAVHRWDVEAAVRGPDAAAPIESDLAADGVDEYLENSLRYSSSKPNRVYPEQTLHLHRSDGPGEWMLAADPAGGVRVTHEHGKGDAAVRGPASSLLLWVWGRPAAELQIFGDESVAAAWQALAP